MTQNLERDSLAKYSNEQIYNPETISRSLLQIGDDYSSRLLQIKADTLLKYATGKVVDLGCGNGRHLLEIADRIDLGIGVDFSLPFIRQARKNLGANANIHFVVSDGRHMPLPNASFDRVFSFAAIYYVDDIASLYGELERILAPGGVAFLEVGNARSINTLMARQPQYADIAQHSQRTIGDHLRVLRQSGLKIIEHRSFQLLPMWGAPPRGFAWTRSPMLERWMMGQIGGLLADEWISSLPGLRNLAFRHLLVCQKTG